MTTWRPQDLLREIAATGYFRDLHRPAESLAAHLEKRASISAARALDLLTDSGLVVVRYDADPALHAKDRLDHWRLELTEAGLAALQSEP